MERCKHCNQKVVSRPRFLCFSCFYRPGVREMYPVGPSPTNNRGVCGSDYNRSLPHDQGTHELPGTPGKVSDLERRAAAGLPLFSPDDATWEND